MNCHKRIALVRVLLLWFAGTTIGNSIAVADECKAARPDQDPAVYLVTTGPGDSLFSLMGHSALWVSGGGREATIYNWGAFDSSQSNFLWLFLQGTLQYQLDLESFGQTRRRAERGQRPMVAQRLDLPPEDMSRLLDALDHNAQPENRAYRYHWHWDNCATRVRDILDHATNGALQSLKQQERNSTPRQEVLRHLGSDWPSWFGWHFMASNYAEQSYDGWSELHVPVRLMEAIEEIHLTWPDGEKRPLVSKRCTKVEGTHDWAPDTPPDRTAVLWGFGIAWAGLIIGTGRRHSVALRSISAATMAMIPLLAGLFGSTIFFLYFASKLDGFGPNENWFHASPLTLLLIPAIWCWFRRGQRLTFWTHVTSAIAAMSCLGVLLDPILEQQNADLIGLFWPPLLATAWLFHRSAKESMT